MTEERMALLELIQKRGDADLVRELLAYAAERLMAAEVDGLCGAGHRERSLGRTNQRNGDRERAWDTRAGRIELKIPKLRKGSYFPAILEPRRTAERALAAVIQEAYVHGVSTRAVDDLVQALVGSADHPSGGSAVGRWASRGSRRARSRGSVRRSPRSREAGRRAGCERVNAFLARPIEGAWPYLWIDATYVHVREQGRIVSTAVIIATAVKTDGRREVLGMAARPRPSRSGRTSCAPLPTGACVGSS